MRAGQMRQRITIQKLDETRGPTGGKALVWVSLCSAWVSIEPLKGSEYLSGKEVNAEITTRIRMRYRSDVTITAGMRVVYGGRQFVIDGPPIDSYTRHRELQLMCREVVA